MSTFLIKKGFLEVIFGIHIVTTGDSLRKGESSLIIMNHRTHDWMYFSTVLMRSESCISSEKFILKSELKKIPGAGEYLSYLIPKR